MRLTTKFTVGDRVICARCESPYSCDLSGYYGHVDWILDNVEMVGVQLRGCVNEKNFDAEWFASEHKPFPFYARELEHAD